MHLFVIPVWITHLVLSAVCLLAFWRGCGSARAIAAVQQADVALHGAWSLSALPTSYPQAAWFSSGYDAVMLVVCLACARRAQRYWVIWASVFALLSVVTDLALLAPQVTGWAWASASVIWCYLFNVAILAGVWSPARVREGTPQPARPGPGGSGR
ncbi:MAG: hypothetical protein ABI655_01095 [Phenylobacterium sp.]